MKFVRMVLLVLFACYHCLFPLRALAQGVPANNQLDLAGQRQTNDAVDAGQDDDILRLGGRMAVLESQQSAVRSARDSVARARLGELVDRVAALEDAKVRLPTDLVGRAEVVVMIDDAINAPGDATASPGDTVSGPPASVEGPNFNRKLGDIEQNLSARIARLQEQIYALNGRLRGERRLKLRAIGFDAASWASVHRGGEGVGGLGAVVWPLGQDGDWALRSAFGVGQNYYLSSGERYGSVGLLAKADMLYRWESFSAGPTAIAEFGVVRSGIRFLNWGAGGTVRADFASWLFVQASAAAGRAMSTFAPLQLGYGGTAEVGIPF